MLAMVSFRVSHSSSTSSSCTGGISFIALVISFSSWSRICGSFRAWASSLAGFFEPCLLYTFLNPRENFAHCIRRSVPQCAPLITVVDSVFVLSRCMVTMKSIWCQCLERGCIQVVFLQSGALKIVLVMMRLFSVQNAILEFAKFLPAHF